ncbi:MAG: hypothetical protein ABIN58_04130 [candidate division WOR-3 bacterium]
MKRNMSTLLAVLLVVDMFLPMCLVVLAWRFMPDDLAFMFFLLSIVWLIVSLLGAAVIRFVPAGRKGPFSLSLERGRLFLFQGDRVLKEFNLNQEHRLLVVIKELMDRATHFHERLADVHLSQGPERLSFRVYLRLGDVDGVPPPGDEASLRCAFEFRRARARSALFPDSLFSRFEWEGRDSGQPNLDMLAALDSFSLANTLLPDIEKAKDGGMSLWDLKRKALG